MSLKEETHASPERRPVTYCMEFSIRVMVRKAARLAVYEEMTIKANIHQTPIIILVASVVYGTSPPGQEKGKVKQKAEGAASHQYTQAVHCCRANAVETAKHILKDYVWQNEPGERVENYSKSICSSRKTLKSNLCSCGGLKAASLLMWEHTRSSQGASNHRRLDAS